MEISAIRPNNTVFTLISFEGPDRYSLAGGLGVRVTELSRALAQKGYETHLFFVGDPEKPAEEKEEKGRLTLHRWGQWISRYYPQGVYQGENEKLYDLNESLPRFIAGEIVEKALAEKKLPVIMAEDWQTAHVIGEISDLLHTRGLRDRALLLWNANNPMGFEKINWGRLDFVSTICTVSRFMKHYMWGLGVNPVVIPNGIPSRLLKNRFQKQAKRIRETVGGDYLLFKIGRWSPDKRWNMAVEAVAQIKNKGLKPKLMVRGGIEPYEGEVLYNAQRLGLRIKEIKPPSSELEDVLRALREAGDAEILNLKFFVSDDLLNTIYRASDAVLANSGMEPFGLVGLEAMAAGAVTFTGATGEDYARPFENAVVLETENPMEITTYLTQLQPDVVKRIRENAYQTASEFTWDRVIELMIHRIQFFVAASIGPKLDQILLKEGTV